MKFELFLHLPTIFSRSATAADAGHNLYRCHSLLFFFSYTHICLFFFFHFSDINHSIVCGPRALDKTRSFSRTLQRVPVQDFLLPQFDCRRKCDDLVVLFLFIDSHRVLHTCFSWARYRLSGTQSSRGKKNSTH